MRRAWRVTAGVLAAFGLAGLAWAAEESIRMPYRYDPGTARDPFVALVRDGRVVGGVGLGQTDLSKPVLFGILWDPGGKSIALVNDTEAKVGDVIGPYRVVEIRPDAVILSDGGEPLVLTIAFDDTQTKPSEP